MPGKDAEQRLNQLRRRAEKSTGQAAQPKDLEEALAIAQELAVHQVELQLQNQELRETQESLAEAHELYQKLFDLAPVGYLRIDPTQRILEANRAAAQLLGQKQKALTGATLNEMLDQGNQELLKEYYRRAAAGREPLNCEIPLPRGKVLALHTVALSRVDHSRGFLTALVDVTELRYQEREAQEERRRYQRLYQDLPIPSLTWELRGREMMLAEVNQAEMELTQGKIADFLDKPISALFGHREDILDDAERAFSTGGVVAREHAIHMLTPGKELFVRHTWAPVGQDRLLEHIEDISEHRRMQQQVERHQLELEALVEERTAELEAKSVSFQEANTALKVLLENREREREALEESVTADLARLVLPLLKRLQESTSPQVTQSLVEAVEDHLSGITAGFAHKLTSDRYQLSPRELEVAGLIKTGKTTEEIADVLCLSPATVSFHRNNIRRKLGIGSKKERLANWLHKIL
ncbi:MAG: PAS domain-containing protein [Desulfarculaceae bacterium]|nr:PAS domain-containing protein [Desulfarculaceae bacterium]